ncbi:DUF4352 domain-containing protein [Plantactinospora sp. S1510]|uniref:DUF4352 domain-containing protein n=1 Tax=Plantactinospora alkalitolerans TaxID=2789879 RepID=A0ABS0H8E1_9ACTN|nr:DUF4352 domain-containing protein [Plantactinospora alkalitolerans]MBF9134735.1 DUF4352 domain-containing protein [Plantactinospora alkalitolerans]
MKFYSLPAVAIATILLAGCGNSGDAPAPQGPAPQSSSAPPAAPTARTPAAADSSPVPPEKQGPARLKIGQTYTGADAEVTIHSAKFGGRADSEPDKGKVWVPADVRICNTTKGEDLPTPSWSSWQLKTTDDYELQPADITPKPRQPALPYSATLLPKDCVRGWLTFELDKKSKIKEIRLIEDQLFGPGPAIAIWN